MFARFALVLAAALLVTPAASADPDALVAVTCGPVASADGTSTFACSAAGVPVECGACAPQSPVVWKAFRTAVGACEAADATAPTNLADAGASTADCGVHGTGVHTPVDPSAAKIIICWYDQWGYWNCIVVEGQGPGMIAL